MTRVRKRCRRSGSPDLPPPVWHSVLPRKAPELWAKVTAPAARGTCDHMSTAELEQAAQSGHCAAHAGLLAKPSPIPSLPDLSGTLIYRGPKLGRVLSHWPWGRRGCPETHGEVDERRRQ